MRRKHVFLYGCFISAIIFGGCAGAQSTENNKDIVTWLVDEDMMEVCSSNCATDINQWLTEQNKEYQIEFISYPSDSTAEEIKAISTEKKADIINRPLSTRENDPTSFIMQVLGDDFCKEITDTYPESKYLQYNGKLYGYGNVAIYQMCGTSYSERYIQETGIDIEKLEGLFEESDVSKSFLEEHDQFIYSSGMPYSVTNLHVIDQLFYIDPVTGKCGYLYDHPNTEKFMNMNSELIAKGYRTNPSQMSFGMQTEDPDIQLFDSGKWYQVYNELTEDIRREKKYAFIPYGYTYVINSVQKIENVIPKTSDHSEAAMDLLCELYTNEALCNLVLFGDEKPEFTDMLATDGMLTLLCNENLVDDPNGRTVEEKERDYQAYRKQYQDSQIEGFQFALSNENIEVYNSIKDIFDTNSSDFNQLEARGVNWKDIWTRVKEKVEEAGGARIIQDIQEQVHAYINQQ